MNSHSNSFIIGGNHSVGINIRILIRAETAPLSLTIYTILQNDAYSKGSVLLGASRMY